MDDAAFDFDAATHYECGIRLDRHPPLQKPPPLRSWMAERSERRDLSPESIDRIRKGGRRGLDQPRPLTGGPRRAA